MMRWFSSLATVATYVGLGCAVLSLWLLRRNGLSAYPGVRILLSGLLALMAWLVFVDMQYDLGLSLEAWSAWRRNVGRLLLCGALGGFCLDLCWPRGHGGRLP